MNKEKPGYIFELTDLGDQRFRLVEKNITYNGNYEEYFIVEGDSYKIVFNFIHAISGVIPHEAALLHSFRNFVKILEGK